MSIHKKSAEPFADKVVIVTGAGTGLGAALSEKLAAAGARVVLVGRRLEKLEDVARRIGSDHAFAFKADITRFDDIRRLVDVVIKRFGGIDIVVNNAGVSLGGAFGDLASEDIDYCVQVNLLSPLWLTHLALPFLRSRPTGMVVNVSSLSGLLPMPYQAVYAAAKFGLRGFSEALRRELTDTSVRVLTVFPGSIESEMNTPEMRQHAERAGVRVTTTTAEHAAGQVFSAMSRKTNRVIVGSAFERIGLRLISLLPGLVDLAARKMGPGMRDAMVWTNQWTRLRRQQEEKGMAKVG